MLTANNFTFGLLSPSWRTESCVGAFIGLRCTTRAHAYSGGARVRWLALAALSIGVTGIWVMHFIGMLGYSVAGHDRSASTSPHDRQPAHRGRSWSSAAC